MCGGTFFDRMQGPKTGVDNFLVALGNGRYHPPVPTLNASKASQTLLDAMTLWAALDDSWVAKGNGSLQVPLRLLALRAAYGEKAPDTLLDNWRWNALLWDEWDRMVFQKAMRRAWQAHQELNKDATPLKPVN